MEHRFIKAQLTNEGFNELFEMYMKTELTYVGAYQKAEEDHKSRFGSYRYKSYESFRNSRYSLLFGKK